MLNIHAEFHLPSKCQTLGLVIEPDCLYCMIVCKYLGDLDYV